MYRVVSCWAGILIFLISDSAYAAHILEPLGTEIAATTPRGRMFGQVVYEYEGTKTGDDKNEHLLPVEFEIGMGERTQLNLEAEMLIEEDPPAPGDDEKGIKELAIGIKQRFMDETRLLPDAAFEAEYAPVVGLDRGEHAVKGLLILSKNLHPRFVLHVNGAYELETVDETENKETWFYNLAPVFRVIPDRLMVLAELNGKSQRFAKQEVTVAPEIIGVIQTETFFALQNLAFKLAVPIGLNDQSPDIGVKVGISKLF